MEYQKFVWLAWHAYCQNNLVDMSRYLELSLDITPLSRIDTVLHWIQSFSQLSSSKPGEFNHNSLIQTDEWQQVIESLVLKDSLPKSFNLMSSGEESKILPNNYQASIAKHKKRRQVQKYPRILTSFSEEFQTKERILCSLFQMSEAEIIEALLTIKCKIRQKDILAIIITDYVNIKFFDKEQMIVEYFPLSDRRINSLSDQMWHKYFSNRVASLFYEWSPHAVLDFKDRVQKNLLIQI